MSRQVTDANRTPPPDARQRLDQMVIGGVVSQLLYVAARLGIADLLKDGPRSCEGLAQATGTHPPTLYRMMRTLASQGVFTEVDAGNFGLTPLGAWLQTDIPGSHRAATLLMAGPEIYRAFGDLLHSVKTGEPAFDRIYGMGYFEYLAQNPEAAGIFNEAMTSGGAVDENPAVAAAYDFSAIGTVVDIAGGQGGLIATILTANPGLKGVLFDQPAVVESARPQFQAAGVADRCDLVGGDFFEDALPGGGVHILKRIIHDWDDDRSIAVLRSCRRAMDEQGRLLVVERVIPPGDEPSPGKLLDMTMLAVLGGRERTEAEYRVLFQAAGFELTRIIPTTSSMSVIEGISA
jgi:O-methyltransferase domain/Dimerisation domain